MTNGMGRALARGALASVAGLVAMDLFSRGIKRLEGGGDDERDEQERGQTKEQRRKGIARRLDDISLVGEPREGEPATVAVGRVAYQAVRGEEPSRKQGARLGTAVHWGYGMAVGALYGAIESRLDWEEWKSGLGYGVALWLLGDELAVPLLGLSKGPTAHPPSVHAQALGAHLVYGLATGAATRALERAI